MSQTDASPAPARSFVIVGRRASAGPGFSLEDLPGTSGRLDLLLRCLRAGLLHSHGVRRDGRVYLVLEGGWHAPRVLRFDGATVKWLRPDERALATIVKKSLSAEASGPAFVEVRPGIWRADGGFERVFDELGDASLVELDAEGADLRACELELDRPLAFVIGDHLGLDAPLREALVAHGALRVSVGPVAIHADDVVAVLNNELDRRYAAR